MSNGVNKLPQLEEAIMVTPDGMMVKGVRVKPKDSPLDKINDPVEARSAKSTKGNRRFEEMMRTEHLPEGTVKVISGDELIQAAKITNRPAADQIAFVKKGKGVDAVITEITEGNKSITHLEKQLKGGQMIAQADKDYGLQTTNFVYRVVTNNKKLYEALKADKAFQKKFNKPDIIFEGSKK